MQTLFFHRCLSYLLGYLVTPEDAWDEEETPQGTLLDTSEGEDSGLPIPAL